MADALRNLLAARPGNINRTRCLDDLDLPPLWCHSRVVEKRKPAYDLETIKSAIGSTDRLAITTSAFRDATALGFDRPAIVGTILSMDARMFFKSMTTLSDHRIWQDVYHVPADDILLYVKIQADLVTAFTVMSFKEK